jgi:four helix bundle protein
MPDFKRLRVYDMAYDLALAVHRATRTFPAEERFGLVTQLRRAAGSVVSNIAEGCGRGTDRELRYFLRVARGGAHEVECQLRLSRDLGYLPEAEWGRLDGTVQQVSGMLYGMIRALRAERAES